MNPSIDSLNAISFLIKISRNSYFSVHLLNAVFEKTCFPDMTT